MRAGDQLEVACTALDDQGAGTADAAGTLIHVARVLPAERALVRVEHVSPHRREAWATCRSLRTTSPDRVEPSCPAHGACGGCTLQHLAYGAELEWKRARVERALAAEPSLASIPVDACVASPLQLGYRNQAKYVCGRGPTGEIVLGAYAPRSHDLVDLSGCRVIEPPLQDVSLAIRDVIAASGVAPFDEVKRTGLLRYVVLRSSAEGRVLVTLVTARKGDAAIVELAAALPLRCPAAVGVVENVNPTHGNALFGPDEAVLWGEGRLDDAIGDVRVSLASRSFFQINRQVAALAYERIRAAVAGQGKVRRVVDAYSGVGGIALSLADLAAEVIAIEESPTATRDAETGPSSVDRTPANVRFVTGDAADGLGGIAEADVVVLNPPRSGCAPAVRAAVARLAPRLVAYLSCDSGTLARDLGDLSARGMRVSSVLPLDMLPHTTHVEALALAVSVA